MGFLALYDAYPLRFASDAAYNIPESGNGIPDLLDEALWGVQLYEFLQEDDGGVRAGTETTKHPGYGDTCATDKSIFRTYRRDYHVTALSAGMFAQASRLVAPFDSVRAATLAQRAVRAWNWIASYNGVGMGTIKEAQRMYAAVQLYELTGEAVYHTALINSYNILYARPGWPQEYRPWMINIPNLIGGMFNTAYFITYLLSSRPTNATIVSRMQAMVVSSANEGVNSVNTSAYPHGPTGVAGWGTVTVQGRYAEPLIFQYRLTGNASLLDTISRLGDYALGLNPLGRSYITGLGARPPTNPLHLDSIVFESLGLDPVPGITVYGPFTSPSGKAPAASSWQSQYPGYLSQADQRRFVECVHCLMFSCQINPNLITP